MGVIAYRHTNVVFPIIVCIFYVQILAYVYKKMYASISSQIMHVKISITEYGI